MATVEENVLVVRRSLFDALGAFQGFSHEVDRYLPEFLRRENNFFSPRSKAEDDPSLKQLIPYSVFTYQGRILHYVRGGQSGEKRLVAKGSIGIGGHINDCDGEADAFDHAGYAAAVAREISEELCIHGGFTDRVVGLINDDSTEVGRVHLGVVHRVELGSDHVHAGEAAITDLEFLTPEALRAREDRLETWSQIVVRNLESILAN